MSDVKPRAEHFPLPAWEVVVDLLVHGDLDGHGLAHEVLGQLPAVAAEALEHEAGVLHPRLPDGKSQILRLYVFGPSGLKDYGSATLRCKI